MKKFSEEYIKMFGDNIVMLAWLIENKKIIKQYLDTVSIKPMSRGGMVVQFIDPKTNKCSTLSLEKLTDFVNAYDNGDHI